MADNIRNEPLVPTRLARTIGQTPALAGVLIAALGTLVWAGMERWASHMGAASPQETFDGVFVALLLLQTGYLVAAVPMVRRAGRQCLEELGPLMESSDPQIQNLTSRLYDKSFPALRWTMVAGAILTITFQEAQFERFSQWVAQPDAALGELWTVLSAWLAWSLGLSAITMVVRDSAAMNRLGRDYVAVDLMRIDQLGAFSRYGLKLAGAVIVLMALWAVSIVLITSLLGNPWPESSSYIGLLMSLFYVALSVAMFVLPQLGIREGIRREKFSVCEQLTTLLPNSRQAFMQASSNPERLAAVLQSRTEIQALPEWPTGQHARLRLAFYLLVPILSWSAAALVEEAVSHLLS